MAADSFAYRRWFPTVLTVAGLLLLWYGIRGLGASYAITRWPVVPARVIHSSVDSMAGGRFQPRLAYEFYLAGRRYVGGGIDQPATADEPGQSAMALSPAQAIVARYPVGKELLAGFDPTNPARTVLHPRLNWWTTIPVIIGTLLAILGVLSGRQRRKAGEPVSIP